MSELLLQAKGIFKSYDDDNGGPPLEVLENVSLDVTKGTITSIVGSSGSGKSTLLHILGGLDKPNKGSIVWGDKDISLMNSDKLAEFRNKNIGFVFQFHHLLPEFTAL
jgi:lipoprotein-releasing system ATP-binding protein